MSKPALTPRSARRLACAFIALTAVGAMSEPTLALATVTPKPGGGTLGKFTFSQELSGSVTEPNTWTVGYFKSAGCQKTVDPGELNIAFYNVKLKLNGKATVLTGGNSTLPAFLSVSVQKYGNKESVNNTSSNPADGEFMASSGITLWVGHDSYGWLTNSGSAKVKSSGTVTTNATGTAGSLDVTMVPVGTGETSGLTSKAKGLLTVKGSWSTCAKSAAS
jgi:hypothetical protein